MLIALAALATLTTVAPDPGTLCATPLRAAHTLLDNLQPQRYRPEVAATCARAPEGVDPAELVRRVETLKRVFDASGLRISVDKLPDVSDHTDPGTGRHEVILHQGLSEIVLVRDDGGWHLPPHVIQQVPELAATTFVLDLGGVVQQLPPWMRAPVLGLMGWQLIYLVLLLVLGLIVRTVVAWFVAGWARRLMERLRISWGRDLLGSASQPLGTLALSGILAVGMPVSNLPVALAAVGLIAIRLIAALAAVMVLYRIVDLFAAYLSDRADRTSTKLDDQLVPLVRKALRVVVISLGVVFVLQNLDVDVGSLIAGLGLGGLAFALAAKDTVANLFGSLTIFLDKPFQIGDWVAVAGTEGIIEEVGFRSTRVRTFYNSLVSVPNAKIADAVVDNYGLRRYRRTVTTLGVTYDSTPDQIEAFCDGIRAILQAHPRTRKDYYEVHFSGYGDHSLNIMLYFFFEVPSWSEELRARHEVYLDILRLAEKLSIRFAFPTRTLHISSQAMPRPVDENEPPQPDWLRQRVQEFGPGGTLVHKPGPRLTHGYFAGAERGDHDRTIEDEPNRAS
ncbi:MAG: mechanosensitive ion channel family protein [Pseudomonadota bacterium]